MDNTVKVVQWRSQVRAAILVAMAFGLGGTWLPSLTDAQLDTYVASAISIVGILGTIGPMVWSWFENKWRTAATNTALTNTANVSAASGQPTIVAPEPLTAVDLNRAELRRHRGF